MIFCFQVVAAVFLFSLPVHAACTNPDGEPGEMMYNGSFDVFQGCTEQGWVAFHSTLSTPTGPPGCANIGDVCAAQGNIIFAGWHPVTQAHLFIPPTDQQQPGSPGNFTMSWKNSTGNDISVGSDSDGRVNHANRSGVLSDFPAFQACENLNFGGHNDWYLPSRGELYYLWMVKASIESAGNITNFESERYWSSTQFDDDHAWLQTFSGGSQYDDKKIEPRRVRCIRR